MTGILIGYQRDTHSEPVGFTGTTSAAREAREVTALEPVTYDDEGHLITIAPTGAGKGVGCIVPALLRHQGPVVALDLKGENYIMTRRHRAAIGSPVSCIDPFGIASRLLGGTQERDAAASEFRGFNPLDLLPYLSDDRDAACRTLADKMMPPLGGKEDPFWRSSAVTLLAGLIDHYERQKGSLRSISAIVHDLSIEDPKVRYVGQIEAAMDAISRISCSPDLLDELDRANVTPHDAWMFFNHIRRAYDLVASNPDREEVLVRQALQCLLERNAERDLELDEETIAEITSTVVTRPSLSAQFADEARTHLKLSDRSITDLFMICRTTERTYHALPPEGSFGDRMRDMDVPYGFPIAMHRLSHSTSSVGIAAAGLVESADKTWSSILITLRSGLAEFSGRSVARTLSGINGIDLDALRRGKNMSLYIAFPADRAKSHAMLFRVIVDGLMTVLAARTRRPARRTLVLLDEVAQLGRMQTLVTAKTLLRGYGVQVWSFWQDISQLKANYPAEWQTILNNCRVVQVFGRGTGTMSQELGAALDIAPDRITNIGKDEVIAWVDGPKPVLLRRPVAYADADLAPLCDEGPFALPSEEDPDIEPVQEEELEIHFIDLDEGEDEAELEIDLIESINRQESILQQLLVRP